MCVINVDVLTSGKYILIELLGGSGYLFTREIDLVSGVIGFQKKNLELILSIHWLASNK